ncbi:SGNH/GDSL hydrolase family protein [Bradyrhizobium sp. SYSU BS000235]|uniref:SGNH/GDSL hydrolase family protein n=1 Tax=Bradyrhizobium sp. SYSU BS000235 TaxID=3411332 RepID=UPI003C77CBE4
MQYKTIAFSGTSLTSGVPSAGWQADAINRLQVGCPSELRNFDLGAPGRTSQMGLDDVQRVVNMRPDLAVIEYAMNDALTSLDISVGTFKGNIGAIVDVIASGSPDTIIFLMTMNPVIAPGLSLIPHVENYYQGLRDVASDKGVGLIDNYPVWGAPTSGQMLADGVHPSRSAILDVLLPNIVSSLSPFLS